jgi:integrase
MADAGPGARGTPVGVRRTRCPRVAHDPEAKATLLLMVIAGRAERLQALDLRLNPETLSGLFICQAKRAGLPRIRLHDLRHSVASILLARGVHPKVSARCWATPPSRSRWTPTATSSHRSSRKR